MTLSTVLRAATLAAGLLLASAALAAPPTNTAYIEQIGDGQRVDVVQDGERNTASVTLEGEQNGRGSIFTPSGLQPSGGIVQTGDQNFARVKVQGSDNAFRVDQTGDGNRAYLGVRGDDNTAVIRQGVDASSHGNLALQIQGGDGNRASLQQNGDNNIGVQVQTGALSSGAGFALVASLVNGGGAGMVESLQAVSATGGGNSSNLVQNGDGNRAALLQAGKNNSLTFTQPGGGVGVFAQIGNGLSAQITQQAGMNGFVAPITVIQTK